MGNKTNREENKYIKDAFKECIPNNSAMVNSMNENNIIMAHIEFIFGMEGKPQTCVKNLLRSKLFIGFKIGAINVNRMIAFILLTFFYTLKCIFLCNISPPLKFIKKVCPIYS